MKRPTWVTVIGILMIIFGAFGMLGSAQFIFMPKMLGFQQDIFTKFLEKAEREDPDSAEILEEFEDMWNLPPWFSTFAAVFGVIGLLIQALYFFGGISMLQMKKYAIRAVYWGLSLCLLFAGVQCVVAFSLDSIFGLFMVIGGMISIVIDLVLLIVVMTSDKSAFEETPTSVTAQAL